jgi:hypothetical protein
MAFKKHGVVASLGVVSSPPAQENRLTVLASKEVLSAEEAQELKRLIDAKASAYRIAAAGDTSGNGQA